MFADKKAKRRRLLNLNSVMQECVELRWRAGEFVLVVPVAEQGCLSVQQYVAEFVRAVDTALDASARECHDVRLRLATDQMQEPDQDGWPINLPGLSRQSRVTNSPINDELLPPLSEFKTWLST